MSSTAVASKQVYKYVFSLYHHYAPRIFMLLDLRRKKAVCAYVFLGFSLSCEYVILFYISYNIGIGRWQYEKQ